MAARGPGDGLVRPGTGGRVVAVRVFVSDKVKRNQLLCVMEGPRRGAACHLIHLISSGFEAEKPNQARQERTFPFARPSYQRERGWKLVHPSQEWLQYVPQLKTRSTVCTLPRHSWELGVQLQLCHALLPAPALKIRLEKTTLDGRAHEHSVMTLPGRAGDDLALASY